MPEVSDKIWMSEESKWKGFLDGLTTISNQEKNNSTLDTSHSDVLDSNWQNETSSQKKICVLYFFEDTKKKTVSLLEQNGLPTIELEKASMMKNSGELLVFTASALEVQRSIRLQNDLREYIGAGNFEIVFIEHYPLYSKEKEVLETIALLTDDSISVCFYLSMRDPLMDVFGAERIIEMMSKMGAKEDEMLQHNMITKAISRAQQKLDKMVKNEQRADSQEEWFKRNYKP